MEEERVAVSREMWANLPADVATLGRVLDLDDLGAEIGQQHGPERTCAILFDGNDAHTLKRPHDSSPRL